MPPTTEYKKLAFEGCSGNFEVLALGDGRYQILDPSICMLMEDYSCGDIIKAECNEKNELVVSERVERGKFRTFDFLLPKGWAESWQTEKLFDKIKRHEGYATGIFGGMLLIALPEEAKYDPSEDVVKIAENMK